MQIGFVQPDIHKNQNSSIHWNYTHNVKNSTWDKTGDIFADDRFPEDSTCRKLYHHK